MGHGTILRPYGYTSKSNYNDETIANQEDCKNCGAPLNLSKCKCDFCSSPINHGKSYKQKMYNLVNNGKNIGRPRG